MKVLWKGKYQPLEEVRDNPDYQDHVVRMAEEAIKEFWRIKEALASERNQA